MVTYGQQPFFETQQLTDFFCIHHTLKSDSVSTEATDQTYLVKIAQIAQIALGN